MNSNDDGRGQCLTDVKWSRRIEREREKERATKWVSARKADCEREWPMMWDYRTAATVVKRNEWLLLLPDKHRAHNRLCVFVCDRSLKPTLFFCFFFCCCWSWWSALVFINVVRCCWCWLVVSGDNGNCCTSNCVRFGLLDDGGAGCVCCQSSGLSLFFRLTWSAVTWLCPWKSKPHAHTRMRST